MLIILSGRVRSMSKKLPKGLEAVVKEKTKQIVPMTLAEYDNLIAKGEKVRVDSNAQIIIKGKLILNGKLQRFTEKSIISMKLRDKKTGRVLELDNIQE